MMLRRRGITFKGKLSRQAPHLKDVFSNSGKAFAEIQQGDAGRGAISREMQATIGYDIRRRSARNPKDRYKSHHEFKHPTGSLTTWQAV